MDAEQLKELIWPHLLKMADIHGWLSDAEATTLFVAAYGLRTPKPVVVEIGSFAGKSSVMIAGGLAASGMGGHLYCVDPFDLTNQKHYLAIAKNHGLGRLHERFIANTWKYDNITAVPGFSVPVAQAEDSGIPSEIDMLFIDGNHSYDAVMADVMAWVPSLKPGGILAMHDVDMPGDAGIVAMLDGGWCPDPIRVVCNLGLGLPVLGWTNTMRAESLFVTRRTDAPWTLLAHNSVAD